MDHLLGMHFTSIWWAFLYLVILCVAATVLDRVIDKMLNGRLQGTAAKITRFAVMTAASAGVLLLADRLIEGVWLNVWTLLGLAVLTAAMMVLPENGQQS